MIHGIGRFAALACLLAAASPAQAEWVASWAASPHAPIQPEGRLAAAEYDNVTISQVLRISEGGERVRIRLSNRYGPAPLAIGAARIVRIDDDGAEIAGTSRMLTFGGEAQAVIPRGAPFLSDAADLDLPDLARVKVELYLPGATGPCTCHMRGLDDLFVSPPGNHVGEAWEPVARQEHRAFLTTVEVDSAAALGTIVTFGDSITDGAGSTHGANRRWPDILANRLQEAGLDYAVANAGISGNRLLSPGMGDSALARFEADVLALPNVRYLLIFVGVNDLGNRYGRPQGNPVLPGLDQPNIDVPQMIAGYSQLAQRAHERGIKVIASPIGPFKGAVYWNEEAEEARAALRDWMLSSELFDGIIRLDLAFADPDDMAQMRDTYHSGDFLHGSDAGLEAVAGSIDLDLFRPAG